MYFFTILLLSDGGLGMIKSFHGALNLMALFTAMVVAGVIYFYPEFMQIATANIWLNGVIIGTVLFGMGLCFVQIFSLLPEYRWISGFVAGRRNLVLPPRILRPVACVLVSRPRRISVSTLNSFMDMIAVRFEDSRESVRYITNTLIFLGLLGTFWGLILTVGGFAELIGGLNFSDETVMESMQAGLTKPLAGMATAFTSSLLGLAGSLIVGFLGMQVQFAQNAIYRELENYFAGFANVAPIDEVARVLPKINLATRELTKTVQNLEQTVSNI